MTKTGMKGYLLGILIPNPKLMIPCTNINLREETRPLELIEQIINSWKWILILYSDFVELPIIDTHSKGPILFLYKQHWSSPRGYARLNETLISEIF